MTALVKQDAEPGAVLKAEFGPFGRAMAARYFRHVRLSGDAEARLRALHEKGFVVHVMRSSAWVNYLYLSWALLQRGLPPVRAVVNLRRWFTKPWRRTAQRGDFDVRFTYARRHAGSGLAFLRQSRLLSAGGRVHREDPFPALVKLARKGERPVYLVPELFVWEKKSASLKPTVLDRVFGDPENPGFVHSIVAFWRNYRRAQFRVGEPIDLSDYVGKHPDESDEVLARKVRMVLHTHLSHEARAVFGAPTKPTDRLIEETLRDKTLKGALEAVSAESKRSYASVQREARRDLNQIASRQSPSWLAVVAPFFTWVFNRIYDGIEVDEAGLDRALAAGARAPIVLCPSHKSHVDYLVMSYVLWVRGYGVPLIAAGANLSFFPLGTVFRHCGAFFLRRSFKGDKVYTAAFRAYIKKLVRDHVHHEFFPEGGRSRTGKLLMPKLGMFAWEVDAICEGAANDLYFVPVAIDYEKVVESGSYSKELAGGEKKPEDIKALLSAPKVLVERYGRIHLNFDEPFSLVELMRSRGLAPDREIPDEPRKALVRALANHVMYGVSRAGTVTPHALVSAALLSHRHRGISARDVADRIGLLRRIAEEEKARLSKSLDNAPSDPTAMGPVNEAMRTFCQDKMVRLQEAKGETIYQAEDGRRPELSFYKNTLMNLVTPRSLVANAVLAGGGSARSKQELKERALWLSRLFKLEFMYRVGASFDEIFDGTVEALERGGLLVQREDTIAVAPEPHSRAELEFLADLMRDYLESYLLGALALEDLASEGPMDRKAFVKAALETGRAEFLSGRIGASEALSRTTIENAVAYFLDQGILVEKEKKLRLGDAYAERPAREELAQRIRTYLHRRVG